MSFSKFYHGLRIVRPINLLVVVLTFASLKDYLYYFRGMSLDFTDKFFYWLFCICCVFVAAGGNTINDYFDVRADRINKPDKLLINRYINPRWAIILHWFLNSCGAFTGLILSYWYSSWFFFLLTIGTISILSFYSSSFKKSFLFGNFIVAAFTAIIPLSCFLFYRIALKPSQLITIDTSSISLSYAFLAILSAFLFNFIRELIKDIQDIEGDQFIHAQTLPIKWGADRAVRFSKRIVLSTLLIYGLLLYFFRNEFQYLLPFFLVFLLLCYLFFFLSTEKSKLRWSSILLKSIMFIGLITPYYWIWIKSIGY